MTGVGSTRIPAPIKQSAQSFKNPQSEPVIPTVRGALTQLADFMKTDEVHARVGRQIAELADATASV